MLFYRLLRPTICSLFGNFSLEFLKSTTNVIAFRLFLVELVLKLEGHFVITILCLLKLNSCLVYLC